MELLSSEHFHVLIHDTKADALIFNRIDGTISLIKSEDAYELENLSRVATLSGPIVGVYLNSYLVIVKQRTTVGHLYEPKYKSDHEVFVVKDILVVPIFNDGIDFQNSDTDCLSSIPVSYTNVHSDKQDTQIAQDDNFSLPASISFGSYLSRYQGSKSYDAFNMTKSRINKLQSSSLIDSVGKVSHSKELRKKLIDEMTKLFMNTNSFYFSFTIDLTCSMSRSPRSNNSSSEPLWKYADERFFWNRHMLKPFIDLEAESCKEMNHFIIPMLYGFIQLENLGFLSLDSNDSNTTEKTNYISETISEQFNSIVGYIDKITNKNAGSSKIDDEMKMTEQTMLHCNAKSCQLCLISRRSVYQAGTRYNRRGCDENGYCANYVETEQIFRYGSHQVSYIIIRGSIPLFWSQPGLKYRPAPVLNRSEDENQTAFSKHFQDLLFNYGTDLTVIDCTEHNGREKVLHEAYKKYFFALKSNQPNLKYIEFDFHRLCRGKLLLQVSNQLKSYGLDDKLIKSMQYYWHDSNGSVCQQRGIFRVNCIDCLDRTNIVQRAIATEVLDIQLTRLGLLVPEADTGCNRFKKIMQLIWANNGDVLSRQYAGSNALKGDFTRTGERKLSGYIKDTYSSASRYYISKFRDVYRQAAIDAMLGHNSTINEATIMAQADGGEINQPVDFNSINFQNKTILDKFEEIDDRERLNYMLNDCKILIDENQEIIDSWLLLCCDPYQTNDVEILFILTNTSYYIVDYDELAERVNNFQHVKLSDIQLIELGMSYNKSVFVRSYLNCPILRIHYRIDNRIGYFHMLRSLSTTNTGTDSIQSILTGLKKLLDGTTISITVEQKLLKKRSLMPGIVSENSLLMQSSFEPVHSTQFSSKTEDPKASWSLANNINPLLNKSRVGTNVLRGVKNQFSNRFSSMRGKFQFSIPSNSMIRKELNVRKTELEDKAEKSLSICRSSSDSSLKPVETINSKDMKIDWPETQNGEFYEDDDYTSEQVMLSIDHDATSKGKSDDK